MIVIPGVSEVRRGFSISLILFLWLGPLAALLPGISESRLPFCCRRNGSHHCAMDADTAADAAAAQSDSSRPVLSAPSHCPRFPAAVVPSVRSAVAVAVWPANWSAQGIGIYSPGTRRDAARTGQLRTQADRGPPSSSLA